MLVPLIDEPVASVVELAAAGSEEGSMVVALPAADGSEETEVLLEPEMLGSVVEVLLEPETLGSVVEVEPALTVLGTKALALARNASKDFSALALILKTIPAWQWLLGFVCAQWNQMGAVEFTVMVQVGN
jgi:hypothetical protein